MLFFGSDRKATPKILIGQKEAYVNKKEQQIVELVKPIVEGLGLYLVQVRFVKNEDGLNLNIIIDKKGGVSVDDCESVHNAIDEPLDQLDPTENQSYTLNVSSAGLDWPIVTDFDFERNVDEELEIGLYQKLGKDKNYVGVLKSYSSESIIIVDKKGKEIEIPRNLIPKATKYIKF